MKASLTFIAGISIVAVVAVLLGFSGVKEYKRTNAIDREIAGLMNEVERLERINADLEERISYFSSDAYRERRAKERLGYRRSDEKVIVIAQTDVMQDSQGELDKNSGRESISGEGNDAPGWIERLFGKRRGAL